MNSPRRSVDLSAYPDLVVVYLGYRAGSLRGLRSLLRIGRGLREVKRRPPDGLLAHEDLWFGLLHPGFRQYWRDLESLEAFTRAPQHAAWWGDFGRDPGGGGVWHETYRLRGGMEAIYLGVPRIGLSAFAPERAPVGPFLSARQRVGAAPDQCSGAAAGAGSPPICPARAAQPAAVAGGP
jgi:hypothetical protein